MVYPLNLVIRRRGNFYKVDFASEIPLSRGWEEVEDLGLWFHSQIRYRPFQSVLERAQAKVDMLNKEVA